MKRFLSCALILLLANCGGRSEHSADPPGKEVADRVQTASPIGLYEGGAQASPSQLCLVEQAGEMRFGLVLYASDGRSCSGAGRASQEGGALRLEMAGDSPCTIAPVIAGRELRFPASVASECAYYCAAGASLAGARFLKTGGSARDAVRARDLVGDPLCEAPESPSR